MTTTTTDLVFPCDICREPVVGRAGYVCVRDETWCIFHRACDAHGDDGGCWFPVYRVATAAGLLDQTARLLRQGSLTGTDLDTFIHRVLRASEAAHD